MCRINGIISSVFDIDTKNSLIKSMNETMHRGGPDGSGEFYSDKVSFGHNRLSVIDLTSASDQPMQSQDQNFHIVFNGEIYNFLDLKKELIHLGRIFITNGDTEVLLQSYQHWGVNCFSKLNGMFAAAIYDKTNNQVIIVRDSIGIKPLYIWQDSKSIIFASELRAIKKLNVKLTPNINWKVAFMAFGFVPEPETMFNEVHVLPKGTWLKIDLDNLKQTKGEFDVLDFNKFEIHDYNEAKKSIKYSLEKAVESHLLSDAKLGVFLSGGIDSSIITLLAHKYLGQNLKTISFNFDVPSFNEDKFQKMITDKIKSEHFEHQFGIKEFESGIGDFMHAIDQPTIDGINTYFISKFSKENGFKAVLSGLGADELLGGYPSFNAQNPIRKLINNVPHPLFKLAKYLPHYKHRKLYYSSLDNYLGEYLTFRGNFIPKDISKALDIDESEVLEILKGFYFDSSITNLHDFNKSVWYETNTYMQSQLLKDCDVFSMWHGLEIRVPYLDKNFVKTTLSVDPYLKNVDLCPKKLLVDSFEDILPRQIWDRPKKGFAMPFDVWFKKMDLIKDFINSGNQQHQKIGKEFLNGNMEWSRFWTYYVLNTWK